MHLYNALYIHTITKGEWTQFSRLDPDMNNFLRDAAAVGGSIFATCLFRLETRIGKRLPPFYQRGTVHYTMHYSPADSVAKSRPDRARDDEGGAAGRGRGGGTSSPASGQVRGTRQSSTTKKDNVSAGAPESIECGSIPWRSALTGVFYSQSEVSLQFKHSRDIYSVHSGI